MTNPKQMWNGIEKRDRYMLLSTAIVPLLFWWIYIGREKYGTKGLR